MYTSELYARELAKDRLREAENERLARAATVRQPISAPLAAARVAVVRLSRVRRGDSRDAGCVTKASGA